MKTYSSIIYGNRQRRPTISWAYITFLIVQSLSQKYIFLSSIICNFFILFIKTIISIMQTMIFFNQNVFIFLVKVHYLQVIGYFIKSFYLSLKFQIIQYCSYVLYYKCTGITLFIILLDFTFILFSILSMETYFYVYLEITLNTNSHLLF